MINGRAALFGSQTNPVQPMAGFVINRLADMSDALPEDLGDPVTWVPREFTVAPDVLCNVDKPIQTAQSQGLFNPLDLLS